MRFLQGLLMGLAYVAPIGMQNLFVINTALTANKRRLVLVCLSVVFFDITLALACFFGVGALIQSHRALQLIVLLVGSAVVLYIGIGLLRSPGKELNREETNLSALAAVGKACVVTWFNPQAIIDGSMMLGAFYVTMEFSQAVTFILGVVCASCLWFPTLGAVVSVLGSRVNAKVLRVVNIVCGCVIIFYGLLLLVNFIEMLI